MAESPNTSSPKEAESKASVGGKNYRVQFSRPLPIYDTAHVRAYRAHSVGGDKNFIAYVCDRRFFPRLSACDIFARMHYSAIIQFKEWHITHDAEGVERVVLIYQQPKLSLYLETLEGTTTPLSLRECVKYFVKPIIQPLHAIHSSGMTYRAFSPTNLFVQSTTMQGFALGQCLTEPAGVLQPRLFETPTAAMAEPQGRGSEIAANDYYALGVMILTLLRGHMPLRMLSEEAVLLQKARMGSYRALIEHTPLEVESAELIRGLLDDNPGSRWSYEQIASWLGGYRRSIDNHFSPPRAKVPYYLREQVVTTRQEMSYLLHRNWQEAVDLCRSPDLAHWLRRSFADDTNAREILLLQEKGSGNSPKKGDLTDDLTRILILLNPLAPILWHNTGCTVTGFGNMIAKYCNDRAKVISIIHLLRNGTHDFWMRNHIHSAPTYLATVSMLTTLTQRILRGDNDIDMLRFLYTLNQDAPCMSPLFSRDYVYGMTNFIERLEERITQQGDGFRLKLDEHILAYIAAYHHSDVSDYIAIAMANSDIIQSGLAQVRMLSIVQQNYDRTPAHALCKAVFPLLEPALERLKNIEKRKKLHKHLQNCTNDGLLQPMLAIADNPSLLEKDAREYRTAQQNYRRNDQALFEIAEKHQDMPTHVQRRSQNLALTASSGLMAIGFLTLLLRLL